MPEPDSPRTPAESLGIYGAALRRWWPLVVALIGIAALAGFVVAHSLPKTYEATARVLLDRERGVGAATALRLPAQLRAVRETMERRLGLVAAETA